MTFGARVKKFRLAKGWTQAELARRAGLENGTVNRIEHGRSQGGLKSHTKLAKALGISIAQLTGHDTIQETQGHGPAAAYPALDVESFSEQALIEGIFRFTKELERRRGGTDLPPPAAPAAKPPPDPGRRR